MNTVDVMLSAVYAALLGVQTIWEMLLLCLLACHHLTPETFLNADICFETQTMTAASCCCRAEATDVANAVLDGVDAMLLGAETLRGGYPVETLQTVLSICRQAEVTFDYTNHFDFLMSEMLMADVDADVESDTPMEGGTLVDDGPR